MAEGLNGSTNRQLRIQLTDAGTRLQEIGQRFLGEPVESVELVEL